MMLPPQRPRRRAVVEAVGAVALAGAMFLGSAAAASADRQRRRHLLRRIARPRIGLASGRALPRRCRPICSPIPR